MTPYRNCGSRQDLLCALTLAVEAVHPAAAGTIVDYLAKPLTDDELSDFIQILCADSDCNEWPQFMAPLAQARLFDRINHAKTRYATFLRVRNQHDIQLQWPYEHSLETLHLLHSKELATFFGSLWSCRYTHCADGNLGPQSYRCFSVVVSSSEFARLCAFTCDRRITVSENVIQTFGPLERRKTPRPLHDIHLQMVEALHGIHKSRFESLTPAIERGNEPWFPFPNAVRQTNEIIAPPRIQNMVGKKLDTMKDWDRGKAGDVVQKNDPSTRANNQPTARYSRYTDPRLNTPSHWEDQKHGQRGDSSGERLSDRVARDAGCLPELSVIKEDRQYNKAARRPPPKEYQMEALSDSGEDSSSVAVASLATVNGDLRRMKSFVRKPSRGEILQPTPAVQEVEGAQVDALPTPPSPNRVNLMSGRPPSDIGLATPPDSTSPIKPQGPSKRFKKRVPSAASKTKARRPQIRQSPSTPTKTNSSSTTTDSSRAESICSMEDLNKLSAKSSSTTAELASPSTSWSNPFNDTKVPGRRGSSGLATFSPMKKATTSVQHIEVAAQRALSVAEDCACSPTFSEAREKELDEIPSQRLRTERIDSSLEAMHRSAIEALRDSMSPKDSMAINGEHNSAILPRC